MTTVETTAVAQADRIKNNVQVGAQRSKFLYADLSKHLLAGGETEVFITALGQAISDAVAVVEMLKHQGMVTVTKIETSRGTDDSARQRLAEKISITVTKTKDFDALYAEQLKQREEKKAAREEAAASD